MRPWVIPDGHTVVISIGVHLTPSPATVETGTILSRADKHSFLHSHGHDLPISPLIIVLYSQAPQEKMR